MSKATLPRAVAMCTTTLFAVVLCGCRGDSVGVDGKDPLPVPTGRQVTILPRADTLPAVGDTVRLRAVDSDGVPISNGQLVWSSTNPGVATVGDAGLVTGRSAGQAAVAVQFSGVADTAQVWVAPGAPTGPSLSVSPSYTSVLVGNTVVLSATARDAQGNTVSASQLNWQSLDPATASVSQVGQVSGLALGSARVRVSWSSLADTAIVWVNQPPPTGGASLTPPALNPILGPLVSRGSAGNATVSMYDNRYMQSELGRFQDYLAVENDPAGAYLNANHYGGLRARLDWAIRTGEPWGQGVTDESRYAYARGKRILRRYLQYALSNNFNVPPQNNTGLADVELLYRLEGDPLALTHIHCTAAISTYDPYGYIDLTHPTGTAPRQPAIALQAINAAKRLGIPFSSCPVNNNLGVDRAVSSWAQAGDRIVSQMDSYVQAKAGVYGLGGLPATAHGGQECYFMNALLAVQLLDWYAYANPDPQAFDVAKLIMDHLVDVLAAHPTWETLPYETTTSPAPDLAAYYVWPALVLWQETGQQKYKDFALQNLAATSKAYIAGVKQWNQTYSTLGQGVEALLTGVPWR